MHKLLTGSAVTILSTSLSLLALSSCMSTSADHKSTTKASFGSDEIPPPPPGMTKTEWDACMAAGTPGPMHETLAQCAGTWEGTSTMWMTPDSPPMKSEMSMKSKPIMGGRFIQCEMEGEIEGMGESKGVGYYGYDNVSQKLVATWLCDHSTGIMQGEGERSADGKTITWTYEYNCPLKKGPAKMRDVERITGKDTKTIETWATDPKTGREFKMMQMDLKRD